MNHKTTDLNLLPRKIVPGIVKYLDDKGAIVLVGARQVGKTSILYLLMNELRRRGTPENTVLYFDLEDLSLLEVFNSGVTEFIDYLKAKGVDVHRRNYLFVDEIQYLKDPTRFLKLLADHHMWRGVI
jgi:predicted AAA+ superfamily ATPase